MLYEALESAGLKAQYDDHVRRLLSFRPVTARILAGALTEYEGHTPQEAAAWIEPEAAWGSDVKAECTETAIPLLIGRSEVGEKPGEGSSVYDLRLQVRTPGPGEESAIVLVNLEAQKKFYQKYRLVTRGIFYGARMLSEQYGRQFLHSDYQKLKKVYSIWICMNAPNHIGNAMAEYKLSKHDRIGFIPEKKKNYDKLSVILICLNTKKGLGEPGSLHHFLNVLLSPAMAFEEKARILSDTYGIEMETEIRKELEGMCNLSEAIEEEALRKGRKAGRREGRREGERDGRRVGRAESLVQGVEAAMRNFHVDLKTACEGIGSSVEEYNRAETLLKKVK